MAMGSWFATRMGATDGLVGLHAAGNDMISGLGTLLALLSIVGLMTVIGINTYSAVIGVATIADSFRPVNPTARLRITIALILLVIWVAITLNLGDDQFTLIFNMLSILLYLLVPWTAVNLVDFFFVRRGHYAITEIFDRDGIYGRWGRPGMISYLVGFIAMIPFFSTIVWVGPAAKALGSADFSFAVGLIVSGGVYLFLTRNFDREAEFKLVAQAPINTLRALGKTSGVAAVASEAQ